MAWTLKVEVVDVGKSVSHSTGSWTLGRWGFSVGTIRRSLAAERGAGVPRDHEPPRTGAS